MPLQSEQQSSEAPELEIEDDGLTLPEPEELEGEQPEADAGTEAPEGEADQPEVDGAADTDDLAGADPKIAVMFKAAELFRAQGRDDLADEMTAKIERELGIAEPEPEPEQPTTVAQEFEWQRVGAFYDQRRDEVENEFKTASQEALAEYNELKRIAEEEGQESRAYNLQNRVYAAAHAKYKQVEQSRAEVNRGVRIMQYVERVAQADPLVKSYKKTFGDAVADGAVNPQAPYADQIKSFRAYAIARGVRFNAPVTKDKLKDAVAKLKKNAVHVGKSTANSSNGRAKTPAKVGVRKLTNNAALAGTPYQGIDIEGSRF